MHEDRGGLACRRPVAALPKLSLNATSEESQCCAADLHRLPGLRLEDRLCATVRSNVVWSILAPWLTSRIASFSLNTSAFHGSDRSFQPPRVSTPVASVQLETWHQFLWVDVTAQNNLNGALELHKFLHLESGPLGKYTIYAYF